MACGISKMPVGPWRRLFGFALLAAVWCTGSAAPHPRESPAGGQAVAVSSPEEIEKGLLLVLNRERASRNLPLLRLSPPLVRLARKQSSEMAGLKILMHTSAMGKSYTDRLVDAGILFAANGENVARSGRPDPEVIHQSFMASPGHRENVLNPDFDEVGLGAVRGQDGSYFVTEDFIRGLVRLDEKEARAKLLGAVNETRRANNLPPLLLHDVPNTMAQRLARSQAAGRASPRIPALFGEAFAHFASGPELSDIGAIIGAKAGASSSQAGIGVWFSQDHDHPGGAYYSCFFLAGIKSPAGKSDLDRALVVWNATNGIRDEKGLRRLALDLELSAEADNILSSHRRDMRSFQGNLGKTAVWVFYMTRPSNPTGIPDQVRKLLADAAFGSIGVSVQPVQTQDGVEVYQAVALVLDRSTGPKLP